MKYKFFNISALMPEYGQEALNTFCSSQQVVSVEKHFIANGQESSWAICVTYHTGVEKPSSGGKRERIDYREVLNEQDFTIYSKLRELRKSLAEKEGVPAYALFTNDQLAKMVTSRITTLEVLSEVSGIGKFRLDKYAEIFLKEMKKILAT